MQSPKQKSQQWRPRCPYRDVPVRIIRMLRGVDKATRTTSPRLSLAKIKALTGVTLRAIKLSLGDFRGMLRIGCHCRHCPEKELTQEQVNYLCDESTLSSWRTFSLVQRAALFGKRFPGSRISVSKLRRVYRLNGIKMRTLKFKKSLSEKQLSDQAKRKLVVLPLVIKLIETRKNIVFVDEAVFTSGQLCSRYWARPGNQPFEILKHRLGFEAVAVVAAIDVKGRVVAMLIQKHSIKATDFLEFLDKLAANMKRRKTFIFLDNLTLHHTIAVRNQAKDNNQELYFNAAYSSHLNPIERLWALAKRQFRKDCITAVDFASQAEIQALVAKNVLEASRSCLEKHVHVCLS